ncbi:unnamed protein product [Closterium sp. NIES-64]|nr:unnamed protein product [Closterium sp. Naga37s-1]CAI5952936.1 unnamed protein product [Closterium sp. NIES-64]CAI6005537.1 unnamed protein product [Closterium sp. NIES-65]
MVQIKRRAIRIALHLQQPESLRPSTSSSPSPFLLTAPLVSAKLGDTIAALYGTEGLVSFSTVDGEKFPLSSTLRARSRTYRAVSPVRCPSLSFLLLAVVFIERNSVTTRFIVRCTRSFLPCMRTAIAAIRSIQDCPVSAAIEHVSGGWEGKRDLTIAA